MPFHSADGAAILRPEQVAALVVQPVQDAAVSTQIATVIQTESKDTRFPIIKSDVQAAWTAEGAEITPTDPDTDEIVVTPKKLASLTIISRELANDSDPAAATVVGASIARDLARKLDGAFFGDTVANGPSGLESVSGVQAIPAGTITNADPFVEAEFAVADSGGAISAWACNANTAAVLSKLKAETGSNVPLLQPDVTMPTRRAINGAPLFVVPGNAIPDGGIWGIDRRHVFVVIREGATLDIDASAYFSSDRIGVRATMRVGFGFPHTAVIAKIGMGGS